MCIAIDKLCCGLIRKVVALCKEEAPQLALWGFSGDV
jgi:hypothetical protein